MTTEPEVLSPATITEPAPALSETELLRLENARLKDDLQKKSTRLDHLADLAKEHQQALDMEAASKAEAKRHKEEAESLAVSMMHAALGTSAKDEPGQTRLTDEDGNLADPKDDPLDMANRSADPKAAETIANRIAAGDVLDVQGLNWQDIHTSALSALVSTGKPAKVKPVEIMGAQHVLVDVQRPVAVLVPLFDADTFREKYGTDGAARPDERSEELKAHGDYCGLPVKVGRKVWWLGHEPLLVRIPENAAISMEPIAGPGSDIVANRIFAQLESSPVEHMTVEAMAAPLDVAVDVVRNAAKGDDRLVYEKDDGGERVSRA